MAEKKADLLSQLAQLQDLDEYQKLHWEGTFAEYLELVRAKPDVVRSAFQYLRDMILSYGTDKYTKYREDLIHYKFFDDPFDGRDALYGLDKPLMALMDIIDAAANRYGPERRILLLHGPVGTAKSTIVRLLKKGLESYSRTDAGQLYTYSWMLNDEVQPCPMNEEPLKLIPYEWRKKVQTDLGLKGEITGDLCPVCRFMYDRSMEESGGDWTKMIEQVTIRRLVFSEKGRIGIGTFQPRDEKNQDATELTGDINYRKIAIYGSDSDPRAFNFDGELNVANRGLVEFIEILKLEVAFLYDLLTASQEKKIKPRKFPHTDIDEVIIGHTNEGEYRRLLSNELMEAFKDRTIRVDIPYNLRTSDELSIYTRDYNSDSVQGKHIAPHTLKLAALWAVLTRMEEPKHAGLDMVQKAKLYDGEELPGFTEDSVIELRNEHPKEGMDGISPRYIQDMMANVLVSPDSECANVFMLMRELRSGLAYHSLITDEKVRKRYTELLDVVEAELKELLKHDVQKAIVGDEEAIARLCANYIDNLNAYINKSKVRNPITQRDEPPNEKLMRAIEEKLEIDETRKDDFRREIMNFIASTSLKGQKFTYQSNARLQRALELKLFEDQKDFIKLNSQITAVADKDMQEKIEVVKTRLVKQFGYCDECAGDVLTYVTSLFAQGDSKS